MLLIKDTETGQYYRIKGLKLPNRGDLYISDGYIDKAVTNFKNSEYPVVEACCLPMSEDPDMHTKEWDLHFESVLTMFLRAKLDLVLNGVDYEPSSLSDISCIREALIAKHLKLSY